MTNQDQQFQQQGQQPVSQDLWFGLWNKTGQQGWQYLSGSMEINWVKYWIKVMKNTRKQKPEQPDYNLVATPAWTPVQQAPVQQGYAQPAPQQQYQQAPVQQQYQQAPAQQNYAPQPQTPVDTSQLPF